MEGNQDKMNKQKRRKKEIKVKLKLKMNLIEMKKEIR